MKPTSHIFHGIRVLRCLSSGQGRGSKLSLPPKAFPFSTHIRRVQEHCQAMVFPAGNLPSVYTHGQQLSTSISAHRLLGIPDPHILSPSPRPLEILTSVSKSAHSSLPSSVSSPSFPAHQEDPLFIDGKNQKPRCCLRPLPLTHFLPPNMSAISSYFQLHCERLPNPHMNWESSGAPWSPKLVLQTDPGRMGTISHTGLKDTCLLEFCHALPSSLLLQQHQLPDKRSPFLSHSFSPLASVSASILLLSLLLLGPVYFFPLSSSPSFFLPCLSHSAPCPSSPILPFSDDNLPCDNHRTLELGATSLAFLT